MIDFITANWILIALVALFVAMHRRGHGCGMHGRHGDHKGQQGDSQHAGRYHDAEPAP